MALLTPQQKTQLPPMVAPFGRSNKPHDRKILLDGETEYEPFDGFIHPAENNGLPNNVVFVTEEEIKNYIEITGRFQEKSYLWVIDQTMIKIVRERTRNVLRTHDPNHVCHTNLTGGQTAHVGGEMFFAEDGRVYINPFSDRYGGVNISINQWVATKNYFISVGYVKLIDIVELLDIKLLG